MEVKGRGRFDENGKLITPKKEKTYNKNIRIVRRVRKSPRGLSKKESKELLNLIIDAFDELNEKSTKKKICPICGNETDNFDPKFGCSECAVIDEEIEGY